MSADPFNSGSQNPFPTGPGGPSPGPGSPGQSNPFAGSNAANAPGAGHPSSAPSAGHPSSAPSAGHPSSAPSADYPSSAPSANHPGGADPHGPFGGFAAGSHGPFGGPAGQQGAPAGGALNPAATVLGSPPVSSADLTAAKPPTWLLFLAGGLALAAGIVALILANPIVAIICWFVAGPVAIGLLALFVVKDTFARSSGLYAAPGWVKPLHYVAIGVCLICILAPALRIADWVGHL